MLIQFPIVTVVSEPFLLRPVGTRDPIPRELERVVGDSIPLGTEFVKEAGETYYRPSRCPLEHQNQRRRLLEWEIEQLYQKQLVLAGKLDRKLEEYFALHRQQRGSKEAPLQAEMTMMLGQLEAWRYIEYGLRDELKVENMLQERFMVEKQVWAAQQRTTDEYILEQLAALERQEMEQQLIYLQKRNGIGDVYVDYGPECEIATQGMDYSDHISRRISDDFYVHKVIDELQLSQTRAYTKVCSINSELQLLVPSKYGLGMIAWPIGIGTYTLNFGLIVKMQIVEVDTQNSMFKVQRITKLKIDKCLGVTVVGLGKIVVRHGKLEKLSMNVIQMSFSDGALLTCGVEVKLVNGFLSNLILAKFGAESFTSIVVAFSVNECDFLSQSNFFSVTGVGYAEQIHMVVDALNSVHLSKEDQEGVIVISAAILCLENIYLDMLDNEDHMEVDAQAYNWVISWNCNMGNMRWVFSMFDKLIEKELNACSSTHNVLGTVPRRKLLSCLCNIKVWEQKQVVIELHITEQLVAIEKLEMEWSLGLVRKLCVAMLVNNGYEQFGSRFITWVQERGGVEGKNMGIGGSSMDNDVAGSNANEVVSMLIIHYILLENQIIWIVVLTRVEEGIDTLNFMRLLSCQGMYSRMVVGKYREVIVFLKRIKPIGAETGVITLGKGVAVVGATEIPESREFNAFVQEWVSSWVPLHEYTGLMHGKAQVMFSCSAYMENGYENCKVIKLYVIWDPGVTHLQEYHGSYDFEKLVVAQLSWGVRVVYCRTYILNCITYHSPQYEVLMLGRILRGIDTSLLFSAFESWLVVEHNMKGFEKQ